MNQEGAVPLAARHVPAWQAWSPVGGVQEAARQRSPLITDVPLALALFLPPVHKGNPILSGENGANQCLVLPFPQMEPWHMRSLVSGLVTIIWKSKLFFFKSWAGRRIAAIKPLGRGLSSTPCVLGWRH